MARVVRTTYPMKTYPGGIRKLGWWIAAALWLVAARPAVLAQSAPPGAANGGPFAIPTFHCLGLYWSPPGGAADKEVQVRYRPLGTTAWKDALPMRYNPIAKTDEDLTDYRGSIVQLTPGTAYEIQLSLTGTSTTSQLTATTWREDFPAGETTRVGDRDTPLIINESGTPTAWRIYDGRGATINVRHQHDTCITINASYVIVRGFTLKGAGDVNSPSVKPTSSGILIAGGHDIVIEDCDISDWGRLNPKTGFGHNCESAIFSRSATLARLVVQRCKLHDPTCDTNNWSEPKYSTHPAGPQCISLFDTAGNHVIRYNECWSDLEHMYNDGIGGGSNGSFKGAPGPDSDIYGNTMSHCWDDGFEVEGGNRNNRIWDNYITQSFMMMGNAATSIGPLYIWRNVVERSQSKPDAGGGNFLKMGFAGSEDWMTGHMYIFHNTLFGPEEWLPTGGLGGSRIVKHTVSRNNILHVRTPQNRSESSNQANIDNSYDFDLYNGQIPPGAEAHGIRGVPIYAPGVGFDPTTKTGRFQLANDSPGAGAGEIIPNFSDGFTGKAPDIGAHDRGAPPIHYGIKAGAGTMATGQSTHGFVPLFDGKTWHGWDHPPHLDGVWEIADGVIRLRSGADQPKREKGKSYDLSTTKRFRNFVLAVEWRLLGTPKMKPLQLLTEDGLEQHDTQGKLIMKEYLSWGDSGVFLRGVRSAQVNIWCEPCGSGEVATKFKDLAASKAERMKTMPRVRADRGRGEWNQFVITMRGDRVSVVLNDIPIIDGARVKDVPAEGPITLQNHNDEVEFRNFLIKPLID